MYNVYVRAKKRCMLKFRSYHKHFSRYGLLKIITFRGPP
jgi:hypothetical protein